MLRLIFNCGVLAPIRLGIKTVMAVSKDTGDRTWGHLATTEHFGRVTDMSDYIFLSQDDLKNEPYKSSAKASHCMLYAKNNVKTFGVYNPRAAVLMQMRFDGYLGFPGGLVDKGEDSITALNREMKEEMDLDLNKYHITQRDYVVSHYSRSKMLCLHFYALEVTLKDFVQIERHSLLSKDFGSEVLGTIRVPLYTMGDGYRGFPTFLTNAFIGNSRLQLIYTLTQRNILSKEEINLAESAILVTVKL
uniref:U8 snoRNA-decapping enzyme n=2 Tax=Clastoptera arizonana TaxID=38151 RepID=A0A1B6E325_9HEMI